MATKRVRRAQRLALCKPSGVVTCWLVEAHIGHGGVSCHAYRRLIKRGGYFHRRVIERPFTVEELAQLPPLHAARKHPDMLIRRQVIVPLELPPLLKVANRVEVLFRGCAPEPVTEPRQDLRS
jgi:hypothetical protein